MKKFFLIFLIYHFNIINSSDNSKELSNLNMANSSDNLNTSSRSYSNNSKQLSSSTFNSDNSNKLSISPFNSNNSNKLSPSPAPKKPDQEFFSECFIKPEDPDEICPSPSEIVTFEYFLQTIHNVVNGKNKNPTTIESINSNYEKIVRITTMRHDGTPMIVTYTAKNIYNNPLFQENSIWTRKRNSLSKDIKDILDTSDKSFFSAEQKNYLDLILNAKVNAHIDLILNTKVNAYILLKHSSKKIINQASPKITKSNEENNTNRRQRDSEEKEYGPTKPDLKDYNKKNNS